MVELPRAAGAVSGRNSPRVDADFADGLAGTGWVRGKHKVRAALDKRVEYRKGANESTISIDAEASFCGEGIYPRWTAKQS
ncbi:hypothetical protein SAMN03159293_04985 [Pseudomonas sp. NFACC39-1]|nr:hypothetical protein SAMN03159293_04985 [Pseudomonas sp. NFACC39-1]